MQRFEPLLDLLPFDGELVVLDDAGRSLFTGLLFGRRRPTYPAFDLLMADGIDRFTVRWLQLDGINSSSRSGQASYTDKVAASVRSTQSMVEPSRGSRPRQGTQDRIACANRFRPKTVGPHRSVLGSPGIAS
jgi:hypothetical protein